MMKKERSIFRELEWLQIEELQDADKKAVALRKEAVFMWSTLCRSRVCGSISSRLQSGKKCTLKKCTRHSETCEKNFYLPLR